MKVQCSSCSEWSDIQSRSLRKNVAKNGAYRCAACYNKTLKGRGNPNAKYDVDDNLFDVIDSEDKAYLLGWIASDGHVRSSGVSVELHAHDHLVLDRLAQVATIPGGVSPPVKFRKTAMGPRAALTLNSAKVSRDVCSILGISPGKKSNTVRFPEGLHEPLKKDFIRGFFDGDGSVCGDVDRPPRCSITSNSPHLLSSIREWSIFNGFQCGWYGSKLEWNGLHCIDFLHTLYSEASLYLSRKRDQYLDVCLWQPSLSGSYSYQDGILFNRTRPDAVVPSKVRASDSGYDVTILERVKSEGALEVYDTGIKAKPPEGFYLDLVPRSSIIKTGYTLANCVGVIDRGYRGTILVALLKVQENAAPLKLPMRIAQLIPRPIVHWEAVEVESFDDETSRGEGGYGSTGVK